MLFAKKYLLSFLIVASVGIMQFNMLPVLRPAHADSTLLSTQSLLTNSTKDNYGSKPQDIKMIVLNLLKTVLSFLAILMVVLIVIAGFKYMTSGGNESKMKEAIGQIQALVVGLLIILASWGITYFLLRLLVCRTTTDTSCSSFW